MAAEYAEWLTTPAETVEWRRRSGLLLEQPLAQLQQQLAP